MMTVNAPHLNPQGEMK